MQNDTPEACHNQRQNLELIIISCCYFSLNLIRNGTCWVRRLTQLNLLLVNTTDCLCALSLTVSRQPLNEHLLIQWILQMQFLQNIFKQFQMKEVYFSCSRREKFLNYSAYYFTIKFFVLLAYLISYEYF